MQFELGFKTWKDFFYPRSLVEARKIFLSNAQVTQDTIRKS